MTSRPIQFGYCAICASKYNRPDKWNNPLFKSYEKLIEFERFNLEKQKINLDLFCIDCLIKFNQEKLREVSSKKPEKNTGWTIKFIIQYFFLITGLILLCYLWTVFIDIIFNLHK